MEKCLGSSWGSRKSVAVGARLLRRQEQQLENSNPLGQQGYVPTLGPLACA